VDVHDQIPQMAENLNSKIPQVPETTWTSMVTQMADQGQRDFETQVVLLNNALAFDAAFYDWSKARRDWKIVELEELLGLVGWRGIGEEEKTREVRKLLDMSGDANAVDKSSRHASGFSNHLTNLVDNNVQGNDNGGTNGGIIDTGINTQPKADKKAKKAGGSVKRTGRKADKKAASTSKTQSLTKSSTTPSIIAPSISPPSSLLQRQNVSKFHLLYKLQIWIAEFHPDMISNSLEYWANNTDQKSYYNEWAEMMDLTWDEEREYPENHPLALFFGEQDRAEEEITIKGWKEKKAIREDAVRRRPVVETSKGSIEDLASEMERKLRI
jgi:hypothetical protein